ncbi:MAG: MFS transporter [Dehalococcoidales bacterium]|nr:MAG: MFS transporter [Dehalococcoidales bacterium]
MQSINRYRFVIFISIILVRLSVGILWASAGPLLPLIIQEYDLSRSIAGWYASIAPLAIAAVSLPVNALVSRFGLKKMFTIGSFLLAMGVFAFFTTGYFPLLFFRACFAVGTAIIIPVATAITAEWFNDRELPVVNGIGMSFINIGNGIAFAVTIPIANILTWDAPIIIYGAFALLGAVSWIILGREPETRPTETGPGVNQVLEKRLGLSFRKILTNRVALLMTLSVTVAWALGNAIGSWLPDYYYSVFNIPLEKASAILTIATIGSTIASIAGGILSNRLGRRRPFMIIAGLGTGLAALFAVLFNNPAAIYAGVTLFGIFGGICVSSWFTIPMEIPGMSVRSGVIVIAMMQVGGNLGNFISPLVVGALVDSTGSYLPGFLTFIVLSFGMMVAGLLLPETGPAARK